LATAQCVLTPPPHLFPMAACFFWQTCSKGEGGAPVTVDTLRNVTIPSEEKVTKLFFLFTSLGTNVPPRWRTLNSGNRRRVSVTIVEASSRAYNTGLHVSRMRGAYMVCVQTHACKRTHAMQAWSNRKSQWRKGPIATLNGQRVQSQLGSNRNGGRNGGPSEGTRGSERRYMGVGVRAKVHGGPSEGTWGSERRYMAQGSNRNSGPIATLSVGAHASLSLGSVSVTPASKMASHACLSAASSCGCNFASQRPALRLAFRGIGQARLARPNVQRARRLWLRTAVGPSEGT
jgi:hypothetical protein